MIINGSAIASEIQQEIRQIIAQSSGRRPSLVMIIVGENPASQIYVSRKSKACQLVGIESRVFVLPIDTSEAKLIAQVNQLNHDQGVDGILIQLPLPPHMHPDRVIPHLAPSKDVDGMHPFNVGKMLIGDPETFFPCTPMGIKVMLERSGIDVAGKHVVIIGRSNIVGKPLAAMLMQNIPGGNATVTVAHRHTTDLCSLCRTADVLIAAIGQPEFVTAEMVKPGAVVVDVGINRISDPASPKGYRIVGDVDFERVKDVASLITPVPGGVGPMTIAMLLSNTLKSYFQRNAD